MNATPSSRPGTQFSVTRKMAMLAILFGGVLLLLLANSGVASAQTCVDDLTGVTNNCTANDVSFGTIDVLDAVTPTCSFEGQVITVTLRTRLTAGANERYDIGLFIAQDGGNARTGACFHDSLRPVSNSTAYSPTSGVGPFYNAEMADPADLCGDLEQNVMTFYDLQPISIVCRDADNDGWLDVGAVISWDNTDDNTCASTLDAVPNTKAKCRAVPALRIPISVPGGDLDIIKVPVTPTVDAGQSVAFTIRLTNTVPGGNIESARLTDTLPAGVTWSINNANTDSSSRSLCSITTLAGGRQELRCNYGNSLRNTGGARETRFIRVVGTSSIAQCPVIPNRVDLTWVRVVGSGGSATRTPGQAQAVAQINVRCATIEVDKVTAPPGATQPFTFTLRQAGRQLQQFSLTDASIPYVIYPLTPTLSYSLTETTLPDWILSSQSCTGGFAPNNITPAGDATVTCTFVNTRRTGNLIINKVAQGGDATFDFTGPQGGLGTNFQIVTSGGSGSSAFNAAPTGIYTVSEGTLPAGWDFGALECADPSGNTTVNGGTAVVRLGEETVTCTYTNIRRGSITITKTVNFNGFENDPGVLAQQYQICLEGVSAPYPPNCLAYTAGQSRTIADLRPGDYRVYETAPTASEGWMIAVAPENPVVVAGQNTAVTVSNQPLQGEILVIKTVNTRFTREYQWAITKTVDPPAVNLFVGDTGAVTYTLDITRQPRLDRDFAISGAVVISNPSALPVWINQPVDTLSSGDAVALNCGVTTWPQRIAARQEMRCTYDAPLAGVFTPGATITNTVTVSLTNNTLYQQAVPFAFGQPTTEIDAEVTVADPIGGLAPQTAPGDLSFSYPGSPTCDAFTNWENGGNRGSYSVVNTATLTGATNNTAAQATLTVNCYRLGVTKTVQPAYVLTTTWDITKTVDAPTVGLFDGDSRAVNYTVNVTNTGAFSGSWTVAGSITISNPAPLTANLTAIEDILNATYPGQVTNCTPGSASIAPRGQVTCSYLIDLSTAGAINGINEARVTLATNDGGASIFTGAQPVNFAGATVTPANTSVTVDDSVAGQLGIFTETGAATYERTLNCANVTGYVNGAAATTVNNAATIVQTGQSDGADVALTCYQPLVSKDVRTAYTRTFTWTVEKSVTPVRLDLFEGESVVVTYTVNAVKSPPIDSAFNVAGVITLTNPHPTQPVTLAVADVLPGGLAASVSCSGGTTATVNGGGTTTCTYTAAPAGFVNGLNTVTATMNTQSGPRSYTGQAAVSFDANNPTAVVDNAVTISDTNAAFGTPVTTSATFNRVYTAGFGCQNVDFGQGTTVYRRQLNTVTVDKTVDANATATVDLYCYRPTVLKSAQGAYGETYDWTLVKRATPARLDLFEGESQVVTYTIDVTRTLASQQDFQVSGNIAISNPNPVRSLLLASVVDRLDSGVVLPNDCPAAVPPGQSLSCLYGGSVSGLTSNSVVTNTVTMTTAGGQVYTSAPRVVDFGQVQPSQLFPAVTIEDSQTPETWPLSDSGIIRYTLTQGCTDVTFAGDSTVAATTLSNTARVRELVNRTATATVDLTCYRLRVSKDANTSFTRQYFWDVTKSVAPATWDIFVGDRVTSTYTVTASIVGQQDRAWVVDGAITISNPAPMAANVTSVVDVLPNGVAATVDCGGGLTNVSVPANRAVTCAYRGEPGSAANGINTATATLQTRAGSNQYTGTAPVTFGAPTTELSRTVSVTDVPFGPLGEFSNGQTVTYPATFTCDNVVIGEGQSSAGYIFDNSATIDGTPAAASARVAVTCWRPPVVKTAVTSYNRVFAYDIEKSVEPPAQTIYYTGTATFTYTLQVTKYIAEENSFAVAGAIVISNSAPIDANLATVEDILPDAVEMTITCAPDNTAPYTVPAGGELICTYGAGLPDKEFRINTARATLVNGAVVSATAPVDFSQATVTTINDTAGITDTYFSEVWTVVTTTQTTYNQRFTCDGAAYDAESGFFRKVMNNVAAVLLPNGDQSAAAVTLNCYQLALTVTKEATPATLPEPGGLFTFAVRVVNNSPVPLMLTALTDSVYGDLTQVSGRMTGTTCALPQAPLPANGGQYTCSFTATLNGQPGLTETDVITATAADPDGNPASGSDDANVSITDTPSSIALTKSPSVSELPWPGGDVTFTVIVTNTSAVDTVMIDTLTDSIYGDITQAGGGVIATTCQVPQMLAPNAHYTCAFTVTLTLAADATTNLVETNVVTARGVGDDEQPVQASDDATVTVIAAPRATIGDRVWVDINPDGANSAEVAGGNGQQDYAEGQPVEQNVAGIHVFLFTVDGLLIAQTVTDANGAYSFTDVPPGDYYLVFVNVGAFVGAWTGYNALIDDAINSDVDPNLPLAPNVEAIIEQVLGPGASSDAVRTPPITIEPGQTNLDIDAGLIDLAGASAVDVSGIIWVDANRDGVRQPEEIVRVPGIVVELYRVDSSQPNGLLKINQMTTAGDGFFEFLGLDAGVYVVKVLAPNLGISPKDVGDDDLIDSDVDPQTGESDPLTLSGQAVTVDVGVYQLPTGIDPEVEPAVTSFSLFLPVVSK